MSSLAILCVDDERTVLRGLKDQLRRHFGAELIVETAEGGEEALQVLDELAEDGVDVAVVVSDQLMPGMKGEELLAAVHERDPRILNVLLTGQATVDAVGAAVNRASLYRFIAKPWVEADLIMTVRGALQAWSQARELDRRNAELRQAHAAALRFVPAEMLLLLGRQRVVDVAFGDHVQRQVHILLSDMRRFTSLVEGLDTATAFGFINEYMQIMERPLREHGGFVVNTQGDGIVALFPDSADGAVRAGIGSFRALDAWNAERAERGEPAVGMGLGINTGELLLGTVGGEERLRCDLVGDAVNACSRIESLTKLYGTHMLLSGESLGHLAETADLRFREVDRVLVKGRATPVTLFEVIDALPQAEADARWAVRDALGEARRALDAGQLEAAAAGFEAVLQAHPGDGVARVHAERCGLWQLEGLPPGWDGVAELRVK